MHRDNFAPKRMPEWLIGLLIALFLAAIALVVAAVLGFGDDPRFADDGSSEAEGTTNIEFVLFDGTETDLAAFRGQPVVVNFWASWCPACVGEMPDFQSVHAAHGDGVVFIGMNTQEVSREAAENLVAQTGVEYLMAEDPDGTVYAHFGGISMPATVFITADGAVAEVHNGVLFEDDLREKLSEHFGI